MWPSVENISLPNTFSPGIGASLATAIAACETFLSQRSDGETAGAVCSELRLPFNSIEEFKAETPLADRRNVLHNTLDNFGVLASLVCAAHCATTPLIIGLLPLIGLEIFADKLTEWIFVSVSFVLGVSSLIPSYLRRHRRLKPLLAFAAGVALILAARLNFEGALSSEIPFVTLGALLLAGAHLLNRQLCRTCPVCPDESG
jgi:hypothetical protein